MVLSGVVGHHLMRDLPAIEKLAQLSGIVSDILSIIITLKLIVNTKYSSIISSTWVWIQFLMNYEL